MKYSKILIAVNFKFQIVKYINHQGKCHITWGIGKEVQGSLVSSSTLFFAVGNFLWGLFQD